LFATTFNANYAKYLFNDPENNRIGNCTFDNSRLIIDRYTSGILSDASKLNFRGTSIAFCKDRRIPASPINNQSVIPEFQKWYDSFLYKDEFEVDYSKVHQIELFSDRSYYGNRTKEYLLERMENFQKTFSERKKNK